MSTLVEQRTGVRHLRGRETPEALHRTALAVVLASIGLGLAVVALLGPLGTSLIDYHVTETLRPGNNELLFPLYLLLFTLGSLAALMAWNAIDVEQLPHTRRRDRVVGRVVLPLLAFLAFFRYLPALADWMSGEPEDAGYLAGPTFAWAIAMLDLGIFLPATLAACLGLLRAARWAQKALYLVARWFALVGPAVAGMAIAMYVNDDPNASAGNAVFMAALGLAFAVLAIALFRPLFATESTGRSWSAP